MSGAGRLLSPPMGDRQTYLRVHCSFQNTVSQLLLFPAVRPPRQMSHTALAGFQGGFREINSSGGCGVQTKSMVFIKSFHHRKTTFPERKLFLCRKASRKKIFKKLPSLHSGQQYSCRSLGHPVVPDWAPPSPPKGVSLGRGWGWVQLSMEEMPPEFRAG